jgi:hypothetical protein
MSRPGKKIAGCNARRKMLVRPIKPTCMKQIVILAGLLLACTLYMACKKDGGPSIKGKWNIINDSTRITGTGGELVYHNNYIGAAGDYYDFRDNGKMYMKEGASLDSMQYEVYGNNQVRCTPSPGFTDTYNTTLLTGNRASLTVSGLSVQGHVVKLINLER